MIEQMKIGVSLNIKGNAPIKLRDFNDLVTRLNKTLEYVNLKLEATGQHFNKISTVLGRLNPAMLKFQESTGLINQEFAGFSATLKSSNTSLSSLNGRLRVSADNMRTTAESAAVLRDSLAGVAASGAAAATAVGGIGGRGARGGNGGGDGRSGGIHLHSLGFAGLGFSGGALAVGGAALIAYDSLKKYSMYQQRESQMILQNLTGFSQADVTNYINTQSIRGVSNIQMLDYLTDAAVITKDYQEAKAVAPMLAKMSYANRVNYGQGFSRPQEMNLIRTAEIQTGSKDKDKLGEAFEHMMHVYNASGGRVTPTSYYTAARGSRGAVRGYDPDFFYYFLEPLIQEYSGPTVGRMLGQFQQHMVAGRLTTAGAKALDQLGLVKKGSAEYNKIGMIKRIKPGGIVGNDLAQSDPAKWIYQYYLPALEKAGYKTTNQQHQMTNVIFTNTDSTLVSAVLDQKQKLQANFLENQKAAGMSQSYNRALNTMGGKGATLLADTETLLAKMGGLMSGPGGLFLDYLDRVVRALTTVVDDMDKIASLYKKVSGSSITDSLHKAINHAGLNPFHNYEVAKSLYHKIESPYMKKSSENAPPVSIQIPLTLDGQTLAHIIISHLKGIWHAEQLSSVNRFNPSMAPSAHDGAAPY